MLTDEWIEEQLKICQVASQEPWYDGFSGGIGRITDNDYSGAYITSDELDEHRLPQCIIVGGDYEGIPIGVLKQEDVDFIIAAREGYFLVLKEMRQLRREVSWLRRLP